MKGELVKFLTKFLFLCRGVLLKLKHYSDHQLHLPIRIWYWRIVGFRHSCRPFIASIICGLYRELHSRAFGYFCHTSTFANDCADCQLSPWWPARGALNTIRSSPFEVQSIPRIRWFDYHRSNGCTRYALQYIAKCLILVLFLKYLSRGVNSLYRVLISTALLFSVWCVIASTYYVSSCSSDGLTQCDEDRIPSDIQCDGRTDCLLGTDEENCGKGKAIIHVWIMHTTFLA